MHSAAVQVNDRSEENHQKGTNQTCAPVCEETSLLIGVLKKGVEDRVYANCIARRANGTTWENMSVMSGMPPYSAAASSESGSTEEGRSGVRMWSEMEDPMG